MREADRNLTQKAGEAEAKFDKFKSDTASQLEKTKNDAGKSIDKFDSTVERKTSEAKSGLSSWFGFGK